MADGERTALIPARLPYPAEASQYGYGPEAWRVLVEAIFPNAQSAASVALALAYCKARGLDPFKRPIHIVPIWDSKRKAYVETIWPGIGELRTTASRTGKYAGKDETVFGPTLTETLGGVTVTFPEWAQITVYKMVDGVKCPFVGPKVYWKETYATKSHDSDAPNTMWFTRPSGQLEKCTEAAALRLAFPEEIGNDMAAEEMEGRKFESFAVTKEGHELGKIPSGPKRKSETTKDPAPAPEAASPPAAPNGNVWRGAIASCKVKKQGRTDGKPWTIYTVLAKDGKIFETFSDTVAEVCTSIASSKGEAMISYETDEYGNKITTCEPAVAAQREPGQD